MDQSYPVDCLGGTRAKLCYAVAGRYTGQPSLITQPQLCEECNKNQAAKIQELNSFEPFRECDFQSELDDHKHKLDRKYKLCQSCQDVVNHHLKVQAMDLKTFLLGNHLQQSKSTPTKILKRSSSPESISLVLAQLTCVLLASMLLYSESLSNDHHACDKTFKFWNSSCVISSTFVSSLTATTFTSMTKHVASHFTDIIRALMISLWERSFELVICLSSLTKRRYLHVSLVCLLLNILIFLKRKTRFGILILLCWTSLSVLRFWEVFWMKADCRWRFTGTASCWFLSSSLFMFSLLSHLRLLGTPKKKRYQYTSTQSTPEKLNQTIKSEAMEMDIECIPQNRRVPIELDNNLNGLSLGLPIQRKNGFNKHTTPENSNKAGSFWSQNIITNSDESPLVSMQQRPLIVPATLHFSGLRQRSSTTSNQGSENVTRSFGTNSSTISSDDDTLTDSGDEEYANKVKKHHSLTCSDKRPKPERSPRKIKRSPSSCKTQTTSFLNARAFLLFVSLLLNVYFVVLFTEWPMRILNSLLKIFKRS